MEAGDRHLHLLTINHILLLCTREPLERRSQPQQQIQRRLMVSSIQRCRLKPGRISRKSDLRQLDNVAACAVVFREQELALNPSLLTLVRSIHILRSRRFGDQTKDESGDRLNLILLQRELRHPQTLVVSLGCGLLKIIGPRSTQLLPDKTRSAMSLQTVVEERGGHFTSLLFLSELPLRRSAGRSTLPRGHNSLGRTCMR